MLFLAGKPPNIRSYTEHIYRPGQPCPTCPLQSYRHAIAQQQCPVWCCLNGYGSSM